LSIQDRIALAILPIRKRAFVEEVTRVTWAKQQEEKTGVQQSIRPAFTA